MAHTELMDTEDELKFYQDVHAILDEAKSKTYEAANNIMTFLRQAVICPAAFLHKLLYAFLRIHAITCLSVSILIPKRVL